MIKDAPGVGKYERSKTMAEYISNQPSGDLVRRILAELEAQGQKPTTVNGLVIDKGCKDKSLAVSEVYRSNATEQNVTAKIDVIEWKTGNWGKRIATIKVPKDASDKVLKNRVQKAVEIYKSL